MSELPSAALHNHHTNWFQSKLSELCIFLPLVQCKLIYLSDQTHSFLSNLTYAPFLMVINQTTCTVYTLCFSFDDNPFPVKTGKKYRTPFMHSPESEYKLQC